MRKGDELSNQDSCMSRAHYDEMCFVLLCRDLVSPRTIRFWIRERIEEGLNQPGDLQLVEAEACAKTMEAERHLHKSNIRR